MVPRTKEELNKLVSQQTIETYEELAPQLIQMIDMTNKRTDLTDKQKEDEISLHMMAYVKSCTNEILVEVLAEILIKARLQKCMMKLLMLLNMP